VAGLEPLWTVSVLATVVGLEIPAYLAFEAYLASLLALSVPHFTQAAGMWC